MKAAAATREEVERQQLRQLVEEEALKYLREHERKLKASSLRPHTLVA